ncbi:MAG: hypothetical protein MK108_02765 [Mariniblastus sp.]|nr:hypothetical protein [Mariniblastus sp.]
MAPSNNQFDIGTVFHQGWQAFKSNAGVLIVSALIASGPACFLFLATLGYAIESAYLESAETEKTTDRNPALSSPASPLKTAKPDAKPDTKPDAKPDTNPLSKEERPAASPRALFHISRFEILSIGYWSIVLLVYIPVLLWLQLGQFAIWLQAARQQPVKVRDMFSQWHHTGSFLIVGLTFIIAMSLGGFLLLIPMFIVAILGCLFPWFIVDQNMKGFQSLTASFSAVRSSFLNLALLACLLCMIFSLTCAVCQGLEILIDGLFSGASPAFYYALISLAVAQIMLLLMLVPWFGLILTYVYLALIGEPTGPDRGDQPSDDSLYTESPA